MITVLLEKIITILEGWIQSFTSHAQHVEDKLDSLDQTASDIETNTEPISDIKDNTGSVITPIQNIKSNTDSIATSSQTSANNTTAILNNFSTLSTNTGRAAAFAEDCANNTLEIKDKITTIASDTTQIRADNVNIAADVSSINQAIGYYVANTLVTEDSEDDICNFDTDLEDYLQKLKVNIPADQTGFSGITITKTGKNLLSMKILDGAFYNSPIGTQFNLTDSAKIFTKNGNEYSITFVNAWSYASVLCRINDTDTFYRNFSWNSDNLFGCSMYFLDDDYTVLSLLNVTNTSGSYSDVLTVPSGAKYYLILFTNRGTTNTTITISNPYVVVSNSSTTYEDYKAMTYPVSFGSTITDGAEADLLSGLVKVNTTPESFIQIQPIAVRTYKGVNNIYSDIGTSALTYRETLKHYLDKNNQ